MTPRYLTIGAAVWTAGYAGIYVLTVRAQDGSPAWWYVALLAAGVVLLAFAAAGRHPRQALIFATACLGLAALLGILSVGLLLIPAGAAAAIAAASPRRHSRASRPVG